MVPNLVLNQTRFQFFWEDFVMFKSFIIFYFLFFRIDVKVLLNKKMKPKVLFKIKNETRLKRKPQLFWVVFKTLEITCF
jgi:hypothetical protein